MLSTFLVLSDSNRLVPVHYLDSDPNDDFLLIPDEEVPNYGKVLKQDFNLTPSYQPRGDEMYIRTRIESSNRELAWTQPFFLKR